MMKFLRERFFTIFHELYQKAANNRRGCLKTHQKLVRENPDAIVSLMRWGSGIIPLKKEDAHSERL
jgi:hypothetical protein